MAASINQVHHLPAVDDVGGRAVRCLKSVIEARSRQQPEVFALTSGAGGEEGAELAKPRSSQSRNRKRDEDGQAGDEVTMADPIQVASRTLQDALVTTTFGLAHEPKLTADLLPHAELARLPAGAEVNLNDWDCDGLYILLTGLAEVVRGPSREGRTMKVTVLHARNLEGDSEHDSLDPYVVIKVGKTKRESEFIDDAGPNPDFNFSAEFTYYSEPEIQFIVMEHDDFSKDDILGITSLNALEFARNGFSGELKLSPENKDVGGIGGGEVDPAIFAQSLGKRDKNDKNAGNRLLRDVGSLQVEIVWQNEVPGASSGTAAAAEAAHWNALAEAAAAARAAEANPDAAEETEALRRTRQSVLAFDSTATTARPRAGSQEILDNTASTALDKSPSKRLRQTTTGIDVFRGKRLSQGMYFGDEIGGGQLRILEDSQLLVVPRGRVNDAMGTFLLERRRDWFSFLRQYLPGAQALDQGTFEKFAQMFNQTVYPRGHALCTAGVPTPSDQRRVCILKQGVVRTMLPPVARLLQTGPMRRVEQALKPLPRPTQLGQMGQGAVVGFASALFGVPEPFTAIPDEPVVVLWISVAERPVASWPREIVIRLHENLRIKTEWNNMRASLLVGKPIKTGHEKEDKWKPAEWKVEESTFWKNKEVSRWRVETMRDRFDAEGYDGPTPALPKCRSSGSVVVPLSPPRSAGTASSPNLHQDPAARKGSDMGTFGALRSAPTAPAAWSDQPRAKDTGPYSTTPTAITHNSDLLVRLHERKSIQEVPRAQTAHLSGPGSGLHGKPSQRGTYALMKGLGRCHTPWGEWCPSGMMPPPNRGRKKTVHPSRPKEQEVSHSSGQGGEREAVMRSEVNLRCPSEWKRMNSVVNGPALEKLVKMQARERAVAMGAFASQATAAAGRPKTGPARVLS